ncbi:DUF1353 domain-containing protein [Allorhodopirellula solitaria]|uniref:DUF1353 domain-containing protein n=1 Tax=Allorhodopirellula solitaria TaxID=2527987 RepID=A0A5C5X2X9_9BACT|nr:DUF1353 domain-containing protein [Allorhodopirellula solitaria]TWT56535.1 hypothetical protein CA85_40680 [Allorhodopirellula solitaria]
MRLTAIVLLLLSAPHLCEADKVPGFKKSKPPRSYGHFEPNTLDVRTLVDGRQYKLLHDVTYVDRKGTRWIAPKDSIVNGASIPRAFWTFLGGPFTGRFRRASIVHDVYCVTRERPSADAHLMFYEACLRDGVPPIKAKVLYYAVHNFGPKWKLVDTKATAVDEVKLGKPLVFPDAPEKQEWTVKDVQKLENFIARNGLDVDKL